MTPGIHRIPMHDYLLDPCDAPSLSASIARTLITRSPKHAAREHPRLAGNAAAIIDQRASKAADIGTVAHDLLLGGEGKHCVINPSDYPGQRGGIPKGWTNDPIKEARDKAASNGLVPLLPWDMYAAQNMAAEARRWVKEESDCPDLFDSGESELTCIVHTDETWLRCRPDYMSDRYVLHYKTTQASAEPEAFARGIMRSMGYDFSMVFYRHVISMVDGVERRHLMLVQEQDRPYACSLLDLSAAKEGVILPKVEAAIDLWRACMAVSTWPGYSGSVHTVEPQAWEVADLEISYAD